MAKTAKQLKAFRGAIAHGSYCRVLMYWTERPYMCMAAEGAVLCGKHTTVQCKARKSGFKQWISPLNMHAHCGGGREVVGSSSGCTFFPPLCGLQKTKTVPLLCRRRLSILRQNSGSTGAVTNLIGKIAGGTQVRFDGCPSCQGLEPGPKWEVYEVVPAN